MNDSDQVKENDLNDIFLKVQKQILDSPKQKKPFNTEWLPKNLIEKPIKEYQKLDINKSEYNFDVDIETFLFDNGVKVILAPNKFDQNEKIYFHLLLPYGSRNTHSKDDDLSSTVAINAFNSMGIENMLLKELSQYLAEFSMTKPTIDLDIINTSINMELMHENQLEKAFEIVYAKLQSINHLNVDEFKVAMSKFISEVKVAKNQTELSENAKFETQKNEILSGGHWVMTPTEESELDALTVDKCIDALRYILGDISDAKILISGKFDKNNAKQLAQKFAGNLSSTHKRKCPTIMPYQFPIVTSPTIIGYVEDASSVTEVSIYYPLKEWKIGKDHYFTQYASEILKNHLINKLRNENQQLYSIHASITRHPIKKGDNLLFIDFNCKSNEYETSKKLVLSAINELITNDKGEIQKHLNSCLNMEKKKRDNDKKTTDYWHIKILGKIQDGVDLNLLTEFIEWEKEITSAIIKEFFRTFATSQINLMWNL